MRLIYYLIAIHSQVRAGPSTFAVLEALKREISIESAVDEADAPLNTSQLSVDKESWGGVTKTVSPLATPVAPQLVALLVPTAKLAGLTEQVPYINLAIGLPSPIETAVLEALNLGVFAFACGTIIAVVEARELVVSTSKIGTPLAFFTVKALVPLTEMVVVADRVVAPVTARVLERVAPLVTASVLERVVAPVTSRVLPIDTAFPTVVAAMTIPAVAKVVTSVATTTCRINFDLINFFIDFLIYIM